MAHQRNQVANLWVRGARMAQELGNVDGFEGIGLRIDEINALG